MPLVVAGGVPLLSAMGMSTAEREVAGAAADEAGVGAAVAQARPALPCGGLVAPVGKVPRLGAPLTGCGEAIRTLATLANLARTTTTIEQT